MTNAALPLYPITTNIRPNLFYHYPILLTNMRSSLPLYPILLTDIRPMLFYRYPILLNKYTTNVVLPLPDTPCKYYLPLPDTPCKYMKILLPLPKSKTNVVLPLPDNPYKYTTIVVLLLPDTLANILLTQHDQRCLTIIQDIPCKYTTNVTYITQYALQLYGLTLFVHYPILQLQIYNQRCLPLPDTRYSCTVSVVLPLPDSPCDQSCLTMIIDTPCKYTTCPILVTNTRLTLFYRYPIFFTQANVV